MSVRFWAPGTIEPDISVSASTAIRVLDLLGFDEEALEARSGDPAGELDAALVHERAAEALRAVAADLPAPGYIGGLHRGQTLALAVLGMTEIAFAAARLGVPVSYC